MNNVGNMWAAGGQFGKSSQTAVESEGGGVDIVQVELSWRDAASSNVLGMKEVRAGETLSIGERGDLMIPEEVLCSDRADLVYFDGDKAVATLPPGGKFYVDGWPSDQREVEVVRGHIVEVFVGAFVARMTRTSAGTKPFVGRFESLKRAGLGVMLGSALCHAAVFTAIAFIAPSLGATEEDTYDRDRILLMQSMLNASAAREEEAKQDDGAAQKGGDVNDGAKARDPEGEAGKDTAPNRDARWSAAGHATPESATLPKEALLREAAETGLLGLLASSPQSLNAPTVPWGTVLNGSDAENKVGHLFGGTMDDAFGSGGWGLSGSGLGGGGTADAIGMNGFGGLGHTGTGGNGDFGTGHSRGLSAEGVKHAKISWREETVSTNGRLPAEVIQRIVRQNSGRFTFCYQNGLKSNPTLNGRVAVKFTIDRSGGVGMVADGGSDIPDDGVRQCVVRSFANLSFPAPDGGIVTVVYPIMFTPG